MRSFFIINCKEYMSKEIKIYTDGSCLKNPGKGGWGIVIQLPDGQLEEYSQGYRLTTNSRMEMYAILMALKYAEKNSHYETQIYSDSNFIVQAIEKDWVSNWKNKGWKKTKNEPVANVDIWKSIYPLVKKLGVKINKVKAHSGIELNESVDELAKAAAMGDNLKIDKGYEEQLDKQEIVPHEENITQNKIELQNVLSNNTPSIKIKEGKKSIIVSKQQLEEFLK